MIARSYLDGKGHFQDRLQYSSLMWRFRWDFHRTVLHWAQWAKDQVEAWPDDLTELDATAEFARIVAAAGSPWTDH